MGSILLVLSLFGPFYLNIGLNIGLALCFAVSFTGDLVLPSELAGAIGIGLFLGLLSSIIVHINDKDERLTVSRLIVGVIILLIASTAASAILSFQEKALDPQVIVFINEVVLLVEQNLPLFKIIPGERELLFLIFLFPSTLGLITASFLSGRRSGNIKKGMKAGLFLSSLTLLSMLAGAKSSGLLSSSLHENEILNLASDSLYHEIKELSCYISTLGLYASLYLVAEWISPRYSILIPFLLTSIGIMFLYLVALLFGIGLYLSTGIVGQFGFTILVVPISFVAINLAISGLRRS